MRRKQETQLSTTDKSKNQIIQMLYDEKKHLIKILAEANKRVSDSPKGSVRVQRHKKGVQFYYRSKPDEKKGKYMRAAERSKAIALIQKKYDEKIIKSANQQLQIINHFLEKYEPGCLANVIQSENELRRSFINPVEVPDAIYIDSWQKATYTPKPFYEGSTIHYTLKNEKVRSKSEVMIANTLYRYGIPYRYEYPLNMGKRTVYPDFLILRITDRKEIYWEHLGLMDDTEYRNNALLKIQEYENMGIFPGDRLIITTETYKMPLTQRTLENAIHHYLL